MSNETPDYYHGAHDVEHCGHVVANQNGHRAGACTADPSEHNECDPKGQDDDAEHDLHASPLEDRLEHHAEADSNATYDDERHAHLAPPPAGCKARAPAVAGPRRP